MDFFAAWHNKLQTHCKTDVISLEVDGEQISKPLPTHPADSKHWHQMESCIWSPDECKSRSSESGDNSLPVHKNINFCSLKHTIMLCADMIDVKRIGGSESFI